MSVVRGSQVPFVAASHEDPRSPGVRKRVLFDRKALPAGNLQMINWALIPAGSSFRLHLHEDMTEFFMIIEGEVEFELGDVVYTLGKGDVIKVPPQTPHKMWNKTSKDIEYIVFGVTEDRGGKTVVLEA